jgi:transposase-like protein
MEKPQTIVTLKKKIESTKMIESTKPKFTHAVDDVGCFPPTLLMIELHRLLYTCSWPGAAHQGLHNYKFQVIP